MLGEARRQDREQGTTMADKIIATIAILTFVMFVGILAFYVNEIDLWVVIAVVTIMALFDFWQTLRGSNNGNSNAKS
jgi:hypothetical protein